MHLPIEHTPDSLWLAIIVACLFLAGTPWRRRK